MKKKGGVCLQLHLQAEPTTQSLGGTEEHPGSPAALKDFIPSRCPCLPSVLLLGCSQSGIHFNWQKWQSASPWELCCIHRMLGEGECWRVCIKSTKLIPRAAALYSCRAADTQRQPWNHPSVRSPPLLSSDGGQALGLSENAAAKSLREAKLPGLLPRFKAKLPLNEIQHRSSLNGDTVIVSAIEEPRKPPPGLHQIAGIQTCKVKKMAVRKMGK